MTWLSRLFGWGAVRSEVVPAAASTTAAPAPAIPVVAMREGAPAASPPPLSELCLAAGFRDFRVWAEYLRRPLQDAGIREPATVLPAWELHPPPLSRPNPANSAPLRSASDAQRQFLYRTRRRPAPRCAGDPARHGRQRQIHLHRRTGSP